MVQTSTTEDSRVVRCVEATTPEKNRKTHKIVLTDRRMNVSKTEDTTGMSTEPVPSTVQKYFCMTNL